MNITFDSSSTAEIHAYLLKAKPEDLSASHNPLLDAQITFSGPGGTYTGPKSYWQVDPSSTAISVSVQSDLSSLPSGEYGYTIVSHFLGKERVSTGTITLDNEIDSVFGRGWHLAGLQELDLSNVSSNDTKTDSVEIIDAGGQMEAFDLATNLGVTGPTDPLVYVSRLDGADEGRQAAGRPLAAHLAGRHRLHLRPGAECGAGPSGKPAPIPLTRVEDRYGNATVYMYANGLLQEIDAIVAGGARSRDAVRVHAGKVTTIVDPQGHQTKLSYIAVDPADPNDQQLQTITDPDGSYIVFGYDTKGHLQTQQNKAGGVATDYYDDQGRVYEADRPADNGSIVYIHAWQDQGLPHIDDPDPRVDPAYALAKPLDQLTATYTYANGNVKVVTMNQAGQTLEVDDSYGLVEKIVRDDRGNVLSDTDANGNTTINTYDDRGNRVSIQDGLSGTNATVMTYDGATNVLTSVTDEAGHMTQYVLYANGNVHFKIDQDGNEWTYLYTPQGLLLSVMDPLGRTTQYGYYGNGKIRVVINPDGTTRTYAYDPAGNTTSIVDEDGHTTRYTQFDPMGRVQQEQQPAVNVNGSSTQPTLSFTYWPDGSQQTATDANGHTMSYTYDTTGRMLTESDPDGGTTTYHYDAQEELQWVEDPNGNKTWFAYDLRFREVLTVDATAAVSSLVWSGLPGSARTLYVSSTHGSASFTYDASGRFVSSSGSLAGATRTDYDAAGNVIAVTDPLGHTTYYGYDGRNRVVVTADPTAQATSAGWSAPGIYTVSSALGTDTFQYQNGTVVRTAGTLIGVTNVEYDVANNRSAVVDAPGRKTQYVYDDLNRLVKVIKPDPASGAAGAGPVTTYGYDAVGNEISVTDPLGHTTWFGYDPQNRQVVTADPTSQVTGEASSDNGKQLTFFGPLGSESFLTGGDGIMVRVSGATSGVSNVEYDGVGNMVASVDAAGYVTRYVYDAMNRLISMIQPDPVSGAVGAGPVTTYGYDLAGNQVSVTDPLGNTTWYGYDKRNRLVVTADPSAQATSAGWSGTNYTVGGATFVYDNHDTFVSGSTSLPGITRTEYDLAGNVTATVDARGHKTIYAYDALNRMTSATQPDPTTGVAGPGGPTTTYTYDAAGNTVSVTDPLGHSTFFAYDRDGRLVVTADASAQVTNAVWAGGTLTLSSQLGSATFSDASGTVVRGSSTLPGVSNREYDAAGNRVASVDAFGHKTEYVYDQLNRPVTVIEPDPATGAPGAGPRTTYVYDAADNTSSITDPLGHTTFYAYDQDDRLVVTADPTSQATSVSWSGNDLVVSGALGSVSFAYDASGRLVRGSGALPGFADLEYDGRGNHVATVDARGHETEYVYDALNRLTSVIEANPASGAAGAGPVTAYAYDADGRRVSTTDPLGAKTFYAYDRDGRLVVTADPSSQVTSATWSGSTLTLTSPLGSESFGYDSSRRLVRTSGSLPGVDSFEYDQAGNRAASVDPRGYKTEYVYDALNRLTTVVEPTPATGTAGAGPTTTNAYDAAGNLISTTDPLGNATFFAYDAAGRLVLTADASSQVTGATWSGTTLTLQLGARQRHVLRGLGRTGPVIRGSLPGVSSTQLDLVGNRVSRSSMRSGTRRHTRMTRSTASRR